MLTVFSHLMNVQQVESLLEGSGVTIALRQRFAFDTGTLLRLDNFVIINIFDDGRYYLQGSDEVFSSRFTQVEKPWDPDSWDGRMPGRGMGGMLGI